MQGGVPVHPDVKMDKVGLGEEDPPRHRPSFRVRHCALRGLTALKIERMDKVRASQGGLQPLHRDRSMGRVDDNVNVGVALDEAVIAHRTQQRPIADVPVDCARGGLVWQCVRHAILCLARSTSTHRTHQRTISN